MSFRYYWEDFPAGRVFEYGSRQLTEAEIIAFARDWDPQRFHTDPVAAKMLGAARDYLAARQWADAVDLLRQIADQHGELRVIIARCHIGPPPTKGSDGRADSPRRLRVSDEPDNDSAAVGGVPLPADEPRRF